METIYTSQNQYKMYGYKSLAEYLNHNLKISMRLTRDMNKAFLRNKRKNTLSDKLE